eukprot:91993-Chlamydomonas_euryale.AAC.3
MVSVAVLQRISEEWNSSRRLKQHQGCKAQHCCAPVGELCAGREETCAHNPRNRHGTPGLAEKGRVGRRLQAAGKHCAT